VVYAILEDLQKGERTRKGGSNGYHISPGRIRKVAECFGRVVHGVVAAPPAALKKHRMYGDFIAEGFRPLTVLGSKVQIKRRSVSDLPEEDVPESGKIAGRTLETTSLIRTSAIQSPASTYLIEDVATYGATVVVLVATHDISHTVFDQLRKMNVKLVILAPDASTGIKANRADAWISCRDVADSNPDWKDHVAPLVEERPTNIVCFHAAPEFTRQPEGVLERLADIDPETHLLFEHVTNAESGTRTIVLDKLRFLTKEGALPSIIYATLFVLAAAPVDARGECHFDKHAYYRKVMAYDIHLDVVGRFVLDLLTEKGVLERTVFSEYDAEYRFVRDPDHPAHALAREFCASVLG
jgi:hypothetical protein